MDAFLPDNDVGEVIDLDDSQDPDEGQRNRDDSDRPDGQAEELNDSDASDDLDQDGGEPNDELAIHVFRQHKEPVLRVCLSRAGKFVVTGGQEDVAHVWECTSGRLMFSCLKHKDSVHCVGISCRETLVATADMSGLIQVFEVPSGAKLFDYEVDDIHWICWHPLSNSILIVGTESGTIWMFNVLDVNKIKTLQGSATGTTAGKVTACGTKLMAGYEDGSVRLWNLKDSAILFAIKANLAHKSAVTCIDFRGEDQSISATGSTDGTVKLINLATGNVLTSLACGQPAGKKAAFQLSSTVNGQGHPDGEEDEMNSIEAVAFCCTLPLLATATVRGVIEVWEVSSFQRRCYFVHEEGVSGIRWDLVDSVKLHSAGLDGCFNTWDGRDGNLLLRRYCHRDQILDFDVVHGEEDDVVATVSEDTTCRIFHMNKY